MKICFAMMGLDIGGAETHVLELTKALRKRGHDITIASNGGVYVDELVKAGVRHIKLPLNRKSPLCVMKSFFGLFRLFRKERFDIVHAHARIPAFICGLLQRIFKFKFMTTAHGVFKVTPLWRLFTDWGERSIAVSEDIKQYLIDNYGYCADNITVTINGIDMERFSPADPSLKEEIRKELGIGNDEKLLIHVSRIDKSCTKGAFALVEAMESFKDRDDLRLLIAGGGNAFDELKEAADKVNSLLGREAVILTGARTDIDLILKCGDFFAGVSRAALEAMSCGLPTILTGEAGYLGIYREELFEKAYDGNFCCRDCEPTRAELLKRDIRELLDSDTESLRSLGETCRETVMNHYSVDRMCLDHLKVYESMAPYDRFNQPDVIISGYYGFGNMGDDSFLQIMIELLKKNDPDLKIAVLSSRPKATARTYGVMSIYRYRMIKIYRLLKRSRLLISGGGTLLQNETSSRSLLYYTTVLALARRAKTKIMIYANGIGPLTGEKAEKKALKALQSAEVVTLREETSLREAREHYGIENALLSADPAVCIEPCGEKRLALLKKRFGIDDSRRYFAVAVRPFENDPRIMESIARFCRYAEERFRMYPLFVPMQSSSDIEISEKLYRLCGERGRVVSGVTAQELLGILKDTVFVLGMRLHVLIYAFAVSKPMIAISYDPKVRSFMESVEMPYCIDADKISKKALMETIDSFMPKLDENSRHLGELLEKKRLLAQRDAKRAVDMMSDN